MNITFNFLELKFRKTVVRIELAHVNFFWGKIGAGKSSIAKLIDYCLGANINLTPALQLEFVQAMLSVQIEGKPLTIYRERESSNVVAAWQENDEILEALIPARKADGIVVHGTSIEVLSDLIFHLAELPAPKVRKGRRTANEGLVRLSFRDLMRFCYIDQDEIDSDFFRLDADGDYIRRAKSADSIRFILGYHQDQVAALDAELQEIHEKKLGARAAAEALTKVLEESGFSDPNEIDGRIELLNAQRDRVRAEARLARKTPTDSGEHAVDALRHKARKLSVDLQNLEETQAVLAQRTEDTDRHINELKMLSVRFNRTQSARTVLAAVEFSECPRCTQILPSRGPDLCRVCGQPEHEQALDHLSAPVVEADLKSRLAELHEARQVLVTQAKRVEGQLDRARHEKAMLDHTLTQRLRDYDSTFLSQALEFERQATYLEQQVGSLITYRKLPERLAELLSTEDSLQAEESVLRAKLARERELAFKDRANLEELEDLFLDCLVRSSFPGVSATFKVSIDPRTFVPEVFPTDAADFAVTSFANMSSGGMKTIFKACFALALHRLAAKTGAALPSMLIIDSAMKNVSERENVELFNAFYTLVYELAIGELRVTQFILIDKELPPIPEDLNLDIRSRHMAPGSVEHPPLIPYYNVATEDPNNSLKSDDDDGN